MDSTPTTLVIWKRWGDGGKVCAREQKKNENAQRNRKERIEEDIIGK
jgi:hypothetical protein